MVSSEVQRTLVKSPPELWAELSDPAALARHLGALGEIRITRTEPERTVEWEAENVTGSVSIQPSGWGTKVTLKVSREIVDAAPPLPEATDAEHATDVERRLESEPESAHAPEPEPDANATLEPDANATPEPDATPDAQAMPEPDAQAAPTPEPESGPDARVGPQPLAMEAIAPMPEPRQGFFARLFRRRGRMAPPPHAKPGRPDAFAAVSQALAPATFTATHAFAVPQAAQPAPAAPLAPPSAALQPEALTPAPEPSAKPRPEPQQEQEQEEREQAEQREDISAELMAAEEVAAEEVTAVLTAVLDRLGSAHHRPFSRA
jgi:hypothetical protein